MMRTLYDTLGLILFLRWLFEVERAIEVGVVRKCVWMYLPNCSYDSAVKIVDALLRARILALPGFGHRRASEKEILELKKTDLISEGNMIYNMRFGHVPGVFRSLFCCGHNSAKLDCFLKKRSEN